MFLIFRRGIPVVFNYKYIWGNNAELQPNTTLIYVYITVNKKKKYYRFFCLWFCIQPDDGYI